MGFISLNKTLHILGHVKYLVGFGR